MSHSGQPCGSGLVATYTPAGNATFLGKRNSPCHRGKNIYCYITDNILAQERWVGAHSGAFISCWVRFDLRKLYTLALRRWRPLNLLCGLRQSLCSSCSRPAGRSKGMYLLKVHIFNNVAVCCMVGDFRGYKFPRNRPKSIFGSVSRSMNPSENFSTCNSKGTF